MTLKELAAACGLSPSAVSKALNGYPDVSAETREMVGRKAAELGYRPSAVARALKSGRTNNLGILYADLSVMGLTHSYFGPVIEAFRNEAEARGYDVTFITHTPESGGMTYLEHCRTRRFDGVVVVNYEDDEALIRDLIRSEIPVVSVDRRYGSRVCIRSDNRKGMRELTEYILSRGHRRVGLITGEETSVTKDRRAGFLEAMALHGVPVPEEYMIRSIFHNPDAARETVTRLLQLPEPPTCILVPDDLSALGGMEAARALGRRIPEDIAIAGYDGVWLLQLCRPRLTTLAQDTKEIGSQAARALIRLAEDPGCSPEREILIPGRLLEGETVGPVPAGNV